MSSIQGILTSGVTGMTAQAQAMGAISDNIANSRTVGYKDIQSNFETLVAQQAQPTNTLYGGYQWGGVKYSPRQLVDRQGEIQATYSTTDFAVQGNGFFAVAKSPTTAGTDNLVTRAGNFQPDKDGYLVNTAGFFLLGQSIGGTGTAGALTPVQLPINSTLAGQASTQITMQGNLPADGATTSADMDAVAYTASGLAINLTVHFEKSTTALNTWTATISNANPVDTTTTPVVTATVSGSSQTLTFDGSGNITSGSASLSLGTVALSNGESLTPSFDFSSGSASGTNGNSGGNITQIGADAATGKTTTDGFPATISTGMALGTDGTLYQTYADGRQVARYTVPLVTYRNPQGLEALTGNVYTTSETSGPAIVQASQTNGTGKILSSVQEESTVDIADEFANMIITQRAYSANSKVITTGDEMSKTVYGMKS